MTVVPLPASPCMRCQLVYETPSGGSAGSRFYLSYTGSAPTGANCTTLASDIETAWQTNLGPLTPELWSLNGVDVLDIATDHGLSGQWSGTQDGARTGPGTPQQVATNVEFGIGRRYRGGKPRMFLPPGVAADQVNENQWSGSFVSAVNGGVDDFFVAIKALSIGAIGTIDHVSLSYYKGFTNIANTSGRERAVPTYRDTALVDPVTGYFCKQEMGSQRRRRMSTTP